MAKNLDKAMPCSGTFTYGNTGSRQADVTRVIKGGDLRSRPGKNNGAVKQLGQGKTCFFYYLHNIVPHQGDGWKQTTDTPDRR